MAMAGNDWAALRSFPLRVKGGSSSLKSLIICGLSIKLDNFFRNSDTELFSVIVFFCDS